MKNQDRISGWIPIDLGDLYAASDGEMYAGSEVLPTSPGATSMHLAEPPYAPDSTPQSGDEDFTLSPEECRIVALIVAGYTQKELARHFSLSEAAIYRRTVRIIGKLGVCNKLELVLFALSHRIVDGYPQPAD